MVSEILNRGTYPETFTAAHLIKKGGLNLSCVIYLGLVRGNNEKGRLPRDLAAHALWHYFGLASCAYYEHKHKLVYEGELDVAFLGAQLMRSVAFMYDVEPRDMMRYWDVIIQQRRALGLSGEDDIPKELAMRNLITN